ncbi:MAG: hypothetical protein M5R36_19140 [Deltaproteobacteria bacterium]|nr:hypothetical protein [Deltaproteobacteria bacterium]
MAFLAASAVAAAEPSALRIDAIKAGYTDLEGQTHSFAEAKGRVVLLNFGRRGALPASMRFRRSTRCRKSTERAG